MLALSTPPVAAHVARFDLVRINQERERVPPGGRAPLCQAIPVIEVDVHLRWRLPRASIARVSVRYPGVPARVHAVRLVHRRGATVLRLHPRDERLRDDRFAAGRMTFAVRAAGRTTHTDLRLSGGTTC